MKVLLTGGAGYIGSHVANNLVDAGHKVHVLDDSLKDVCDDRILYSKPTGYFFNIDL